MNLFEELQNTIKQGRTITFKPAFEHELGRMKVNICDPLKNRQIEAEITPLEEMQFPDTMLSMAIKQLNEKL